MSALPPTGRKTVSLQHLTTLGTGVQTDEPRRLRAPDAPLAPQTESQARPQHLSRSGTLVGRKRAALLGVLLLSGCASLPPGSPIVDPSTPEVAQHVTHFSSDGPGWVVAAEPSHTVPPEMADILDLVARARFSNDGKFAIVLDPEVGSRIHQSPWNHTELRSLVGALEAYAAGGSFAQVDVKTASAFFDEIIPVFREVGPAAQAGLGLDVRALDAVEKTLLTLEQQRAALGKG